MIELFLEIEPYPKRTGTFSLKNGRFFANAKTKKFEANVATMLREKYPEQVFDKSTPLSLEVTFYLRRPKTVTREYPVVKPDLSNLIKSFEDALQKVLMDGDQQIINIKASKRYAKNEQQVGIYMLLFKHEG